MSVSYDARLSTDRFAAIQEDHIKFLLDKDTSSIPVDENLTTKWAGDFYGLLREIGVKDDLHYIVTRLNGLTSSNDDIDDIDLITIPTEASMQLLFQSAN